MAKLEESVKLNKPFKSEDVLIRDKFYQIFVFPVTTNLSGVPGDATVGGGVVIFHDVTAERSIEQIREQFTSMIVHELRTPLSGINKISELLRGGRKKLQKKDFDEYIRMISTDSMGMLALVNDILDISKLEAGKFEVKKEPTDIKAVIDNRIDFFKPSATDAKLTFHVTYDKSLPALVPIDQATIKQVLNNLISNALKFTKAGGAIEILVLAHTTGEHISDELAALPAQPSVPLPEEPFTSTPASVVVVVSDTGAGITEAQIKELFTKFKQLDTTSQTGVKGTGLGLAIAKGIVEAHGGSIGVASQAGVGSAFFFVVPL